MLGFLGPTCHQNNDPTAFINSCLQLSGVGIHACTSNVAGFALDGSNFHSSIVSPKLMNNCAIKRKAYPLPQAVLSQLLVGAAGLEPATLGLEGSTACFIVSSRNHIFH